MRVLDDSQVEHFDTEYVTDDVWARLVPVIRGSFADGRFSFLDIGGGNGKFADRMLAEFPECSGTVLDTSQLLLDRNAPHPRKTLVCDGAENVERIGTRFDIACMHWVLHHLVGDTYRESRANIVAQLETTKRVLSDRGRISVFENLYDGVWVDSAPGRLIYELTSSRAIGRVVRRLGANTAGVGVCFLSEAQWRRTIEQAGGRIESEFAGGPRRLAWTWRLLLHVGSVRRGHFWLAP